MWRWSDGDWKEYCVAVRNRDITSLRSLCWPPCSNWVDSAEARLLSELDQSGWGGSQSSRACLCREMASSRSPLWPCSNWVESAFARLSSELDQSGWGGRKSSRACHAEKKITLLTSLLKPGWQCICKIVEWARSKNLRACLCREMASSRSLCWPLCSNWIDSAFARLLSKLDWRGWGGSWSLRACLCREMTSSRSLCWPPCSSRVNSAVARLLSKLDQRGWGGKSLPVQRNGFIKITLLTSLLKLNWQCICKIAEWAGLKGMGWKSELKSLPAQRNGFIEITLLTYFLKSGQQCSCKIAEQAGSKGMGWKELACAEKWLHQDHSADLFAQIELTVHLQDCWVSWIEGDGVEGRAQDLACAEKWLHWDHFADLLA